MGEWVKLKTEDWQEIGGYVAKPAGEPVAGLVVIQEIFGVNKSIRKVVDDYAAEGFLTIAPAIFDRFEKDVELGYGAEDMQKAFQHFYPKLNPEVTLKDVAAAFHYAKQAGKPVAVLGFCYGGLMAWVSAVRGEKLKMQPDCCVGYYPGGIGRFAAEEPVCPVMLHFGAADEHIGADQIDAVRKANPDVEIFQYEGAGHAFANPDRPSYVAAAAKLADQRSLEFLRANLA